MVSPWKRLARWVSPRREPKEENGSADDVKPEVSVSTGLTETAADTGLDSTEHLAVGLPQPDDQIDAVSEDPERVLETGNGVQPSAGIESAASVGTVHATVSDDADTGVGDDVPKPSQTSGSVPRKRRRGGKKAEAVEVALQPSPLVATLSDDAISLDDEISVLRSQLTTRLQLQNAQLKRMLERFEP